MSSRKKSKILKNHKELEVDQLEWLKSLLDLENGNGDTKIYDMIDATNDIDSPKLKLNSRKR